MNSENQKLIQQARLALNRGKQQAVRVAKRDKAAHDAFKAEVELLLDDLKSEGVDVNTPEGLAIARVVIVRKAMSRSVAAGPRMDMDDWPEGM